GAGRSASTFACSSALRLASVSSRRRCSEAAACSLSTAFLAAAARSSFDGSRTCLASPARPPHRSTHLVRAQPADGQHACSRRADPTPEHMVSTLNVLRTHMASHSRNRIDQSAGIAPKVLIGDIVLLVVHEVTDLGG